MLETRGAVILDVVVDQMENCFPMIPSGRRSQRDVCSAPRTKPNARSPKKGWSSSDLDGEHMLWLISNDTRWPFWSTTSRYSRPGRRPIFRARLQHRELDRRRVDRANNLSRITVVTSGTRMIIEQIKAQLSRLVPVHRVHGPDRRRAVCRARDALIK